MKKIYLFLSAIVLVASCSPGKTGEIVKFKIYCDSCYVQVNNEWINQRTNEKGGEIAFDKVVIDSASVDIERYDLFSCIRLSGFQNYTNDTARYTYTTGNIIIGDYTQYSEQGLCN